MALITLAEIFTNDLVVQRQKKIPVWGEGENGVSVEVEFDSERVQTVVENGVWSVEFPPMEAASKKKLRVTAKKPDSEETQEILIENIAVGEVWIASGQSNMEFLYRYDIERTTVNEKDEDEDLRFFDIPEVSYEGQLEAGHYEDYGFWRSFKEENADWFSAVGYYFGRKLREKLQVPVGIIGCNWGGSNAATWTSPQRIQEYLETRKVVEDYLDSLKAMDMDAYMKATDYMTAKDPVEERATTDQFMMGIPFKEIEAKRKNKQSEEDRQYFMLNMQIGPRSFRRPSGLYEMMLKKILPCEVRGALWYQGEEDEISRSDFYDVSLTAIINSFRDRWEKLPFLIVQLPPFEGNAFALARKYPVIRKMQQKVSETLPNVWCACTTDAGDRNNIHPRHKRPVGERLSRLALKHVYGVKVEADSPKAVEIGKEEDSVILRFDNTAGGIQIQGEYVKGLELYVEGYRVHPDIRTEHDLVILTSESLVSVKNQIVVKYAMDNYFEANLYNLAGLPVFPFEMVL